MCTIRHSFLQRGEKKKSLKGGGKKQWDIGKTFVLRCMILKKSDHLGRGRPDLSGACLFVDLFFFFFHFKVSLVFSMRVMDRGIMFCSVISVCVYLFVMIRIHGERKKEGKEGGKKDGIFQTHLILRCLLATAAFKNEFAIIKSTSVVKRLILVRMRVFGLGQGVVWCGVFMDSIYPPPPKKTKEKKKTNFTTGFFLFPFQQIYII